MLIAAAAVVLLIWIYLLAGHGQFWRISRFPEPALSELGQNTVAVVIPARNEAEVIGRAVASLLRSQGLRGLQIFLVDDGSSDGTAEAARQAAQSQGKPEMLTVIAGKPLASSWSGKLWAVHQGIQRASEINPEFLLLTDADIEHGPFSIATSVAISENGQYDLVSFMAKLYCRSFAERALIPAFVYFFFQLYPPAWISSPCRSTAGAAGGSILIRPGSLERAGGVSAIRGEIIDDCALARLIKRHGGRVWLGMSEEIKSIRPYGSFAEIGKMISRSAFNQLRHSTLLLLIALAGMALTYILPPLLAVFSHQLLPSFMGAAAWLLMGVSFLPVLRFYRLVPLWSLLLPAIALFYMGATFHSAFKFWTGLGGEWKGRVQDPADKP